jgi:TonB family protein
MQACVDGSYAEAAQYFEEAVTLKPDYIDARRRLAAAYIREYLSDADTPKNSAPARKAEESLLKILDLAAGDKVAIISLGGLKFAEANATPFFPADERISKFDESKGWFEKLLAVEPSNRDALYSLAVIDWAKAHPRLVDVREISGMKPEDPGPIHDAEGRQDLLVHIGPLYDDAIKKLNRVLELDAHDKYAMAYLNLCIRENAELAASRGEYTRRIKEADGWADKAQGERAPLDAAGPPCDLSTEASRLVQISPPPPPAPPPSPPPPPDLSNPKPTFDMGGLLTPRPRKPAAGSGAPLPPSSPQRIRVAGNLMAQKLVTKADPIYPQLAIQSRVQGTVHFTAIVGQDGHITNLQLIGGHPLLVSAAKDAVEQYVYKPTTVKGAPVEVVTQIDVSFTLTDAK